GWDLLLLADLHLDRGRLARDLDDIVRLHGGYHTDQRDRSGPRSGIDLDAEPERDEQHDMHESGKPECGEEDPRSIAPIAAPRMGLGPLAGIVHERTNPLSRGGSVRAARRFAALPRAVGRA